MLSRLFCLLLDHVFAERPREAGGYLYGDCARCHRFVVARAR
jgi:hypothetical protein